MIQNTAVRRYSMSVQRALIGHSYDSSGRLSWQWDFTRKRGCTRYRWRFSTTLQPSGNMSGHSEGMPSRTMLNTYGRRDMEWSQWSSLCSCFRGHHFTRPFMSGSSKSKSSCHRSPINTQHRSAHESDGSEPSAQRRPCQETLATQSRDATLFGNFATRSLR